MECTGSACAQRRSRWGEGRIERVEAWVGRGQGRGLSIAASFACAQQQAAGLHTRIMDCTGSACAQRWSRRGDRS